MRSRAASAASHVFESYAALARLFADPLGSFHVAGNFTVIYDGGMNPRPRAEQEENEFAARSPSPRFH